MDWNETKELLNQLVEQQKNSLLHCGRRFIPTLTPEDMLQPNDYVELENNPHFRYEEGLLHGIQTVQMALQALKQEKLQ